MFAVWSWIAEFGQFVIVTGVAFIALTLLTSYLRFEQRVASRPDSGASGPRGVPVLEACVARRLGAWRRQPFCVLWWDMGPDPPAGSPASADGLEERIRSGVRRTDDVVWVTERSIGLVIDGAPAVGRQVAHRLTAGWGASIAVAGFPDHGRRAWSLVDAARTAAGGSSARSGRVRVAGGPLPPPAPRPTPDDVLAAIPADERDWVDPRTGFLAAARLTEVLRKRFAESRRRGRPLSLAGFEIVHGSGCQPQFDETGQATLLAYIGSFVQSAVRETDLLAHLDPGRFLAMLDADVESAERIMERLQRDLARRAIPVGPARLRLAFAAGIAGMPAHGRNADEVLRRALRALDAARSSADACCVVYTASLEAQEAARPDIAAFG